MKSMDESRRALISAAALLRSQGHDHAATLLDEIVAGKWTLVREPRYDEAVTSLSPLSERPR